MGVLSYFLKVSRVFFAKKGGGGVFAKFENYMGTFLRWRGWVVVKGMIFENPSYVPQGRSLRHCPTSKF